MNVIKLTKTKKYELTNETLEWDGHTLHRIKALKDFDYIKSGELGGWIESEENLSHEGNCWVYHDAKVYENAYVFEDAKIFHSVQLLGDSKVYGNAEIWNFNIIMGCIKIHGNIKIVEGFEMNGYADIYDKESLDCYNEKIKQYKNFNKSIYIDLLKTLKTK